MRSILGNSLTLEGLVGRLTTFELSNFDSYKPESLESSFKAKLLLKDSDEKKQRKKRRIKNVSSGSDTEEEDVEQLEALLARIFHRGKGKFKSKLPIICFNCNEVGHIAARCPEKIKIKWNDKYKGKRSEDSRKYKNKGKKSYIVEGGDSNENDDEVVYVAIKDELDEDEATTLVTCVNKNAK